MRGVEPPRFTVDVVKECGCVCVGVQSSRDELWALGMQQESCAMQAGGRRDLLRGVLPGQFVQKAE